MENLVLSFNVVLPLVIMMTVGYVLKITGFLDKTTLKKMNSVIFKVLLPTSLFYNVYTSKIDNIIEPEFICFCVVSSLCVFFVAVLVVCLLEKNVMKRGALIQGIFRSNFLIYGLPVSVALFGDSAASLTSFAIAVIIPVYNLLAVVVLEFFRGSSPDFKKIIRNIITNPLIIGSVLGLVALHLNFKLPAAVESAVKDIGKTATPLALILLGGTLDFNTVKCNIKELIIGISGKLIFSPLIVLIIAVLIGYRNVELAVMLAAFASPTAVSSMTMAQEMDSDYELAGQLVMFSTVISIFTVFIFIFALKQLGFM